MSLNVGGNQMESVTGTSPLRDRQSKRERNRQPLVGGHGTTAGYVHVLAMKTDTTIHLNAGVSAVIEPGGPDTES